MNGFASAPEATQHMIIDPTRRLDDEVQRRSSRSLKAAKHVSLEMLWQAQVFGNGNAVYKTHQKKCFAVYPT